MTVVLSLAIRTAAATGGVLAGYRQGMRVPRLATRVATGGARVSFGAIESINNVRMRLNVSQCRRCSAINSKQMRESLMPSELTYCIY